MGVSSSSTIRRTSAEVYLQSDGFLPLFPHAAPHNFRVVALNLRDYPGSTPCTDDEVENICSTDASTQELAVRAQGKEIATFIKNFVAAENPPAVKEVDGKKTGGVAVMSWSLGNAWSLSLLANLEYIDDATRFVLEKWLRTFILYGERDAVPPGSVPLTLCADPPHYPIGRDLPEELYVPLRDPRIPLEKMGAAFGRWATGFVTPLPELTTDVQILSARQDLYEVTKQVHLAPTVDQVPKDDLGSLVFPGVLDRSARYIFTSMPFDLYRRNTEKALFRPPIALANVGILLVWCDMSPGTCPWAAKTIVDQYEEASAAGSRLRPLEVLKMENANHCVCSDPATDVQRVSNMAI